MPILLICSFFIAFFIAFILVFILAKITSVTAMPKKNKDEFDTAGIKYDCTVKNVNVKTKMSSVYRKPHQSNSVM